MTILFFFFKETATTEIYTYLHTRSLPDALPILAADQIEPVGDLVDPVLRAALEDDELVLDPCEQCLAQAHHARGALGIEHVQRSEEHPSELQSLMRILYAVLCLNKKKQ